MSYSSGNPLESPANRQELFKMLSASPEDAIFPHQIHSNFVEIISPQKNNPIPECDALITNDLNTILTIQTADCFPIFIFDPNQHTIALIHAGWRGTHSKILPQTINKLCTHFQCIPGNLIISFGPGIRACCYEVSDDFMNYFPNGSLIQINQKYHLDLIKENTNQAITNGIHPKNILSGSSICTSCNNDLFYSYRKEKGQCGRMISILTMKKNN